MCNTQCIYLLIGVSLKVNNLVNFVGGIHAHDFQTCFHLRIDCYFRAHMEYKRPDVGLKIP